MSTDQDFARIVRSWLQADEHESAARVIGLVLDRLDATPQRGPWWRAWSRGPAGNMLKLATATAAVTLAVAIGLGIYINRPGPLPAASPSPSPSLSAPAGPATTVPVTEPPSGPTPSTPLTSTPGAARAPWIAFYWERSDETEIPPTEILAMRADGSNAHRLDLPGPEVAGLAWSKDGRRLLAVYDFDVYVAEVGDEIGPFIDTGIDTGGEVACVDGAGAAAPCQDAAFDWAPNGEHVVFVQSCTDVPIGCYSLTILSLVTGERRELYQSPSQIDGALRIELPAWSPDGTQITFEQSNGLWVINSDGTNLRQIDPGDEITDPREPRWSPDGSRIAFTASGHTSYAMNSDPAATGGADVSSFAGGDQVCCPEWVNDDQVRVMGPTAIGLVGCCDFFLATDHSRASEPILSIGDALSAIEPPGEVVIAALPGDPGRLFLWQPID